MLNELEFIVFQSRIEISKFLTKGGICQANSRNIYSCLSKITLPVLEKKGISLNYTGLKSKVMSKTLFILHISIINIIYKN